MSAGEETSSAYIVCLPATGAQRHHRPAASPSPFPTSSPCLRSVSDWLKSACWGRPATGREPKLTQGSAYLCVMYVIYRTWMANEVEQRGEASVLSGSACVSFSSIWLIVFKGSWLRFGAWHLPERLVIKAAKVQKFINVKKTCSDFRYWITKGVCSGMMWNLAPFKRENKNNGNNKNYNNGHNIDNCGAAHSEGQLLFLW